PEYADTVGPTRQYVRTGDGAQPGDPAKAAEAILQALDADEPPLRLVLGSDAIGNIERRLHALGDELDAWRAVGAATALEGAG
ncbi:MAG: hypothetical protein QOD72_3353, partial [Acidimicrobiaceae bacterium]|nr:hypothetical protein [Acidimicrobiaceae bacterium]